MPDLTPPQILDAVTEVLIGGQWIGVADASFEVTQTAPIQVLLGDPFPMPGFRFTPSDGRDGEIVGALDLIQAFRIED